MAVSEPTKGTPPLRPHCGSKREFSFANPWVSTEKAEMERQLREQREREESEPELSELGGD